MAQRKMFFDGSGCGGRLTAAFLAVARVSRTGGLTCGAAVPARSSGRGGTESRTALISLVIPKLVRFHKIRTQQPRAVCINVAMTDCSHRELRLRSRS